MGMPSGGVMSLSAAPTRKSVLSTAITGAAKYPSSGAVSRHAHFQGLMFIAYSSPLEWLGNGHSPFPGEFPLEHVNVEQCLVHHPFRTAKLDQRYAGIG